MRHIKRHLPWFIALILTVFALTKTTSGQFAQAQSEFRQAAGNFLNYLPLVLKPAFTYLPVVSSAPSMPGWNFSAWMGPDGGSAVTLDADPNNANIFYAGSGGGGVFKSTNAGLSWNQASAGLGNLTIDSFAVDPQNSNILIAGTHGGGVYRSTNAGQSWYAINNGIQGGAVVYSVAVNPGNHNILYAGTRDAGTVSNGVTHYTGRLYKSTDGGASWYNTLTTSDDWAYSIAADANHPNTVLAAIHVSGPFISHDYGDNWQLSTISMGEWFKGRAVAYDPRAGLQRAYYSAWHNDFYISSNDGSSWSESNSGLGASHVYPNGIAIKPDNPDTVYLAVHNSGPAGVMKSTNAGGSWSGAGLVGDTVYSVATTANTLVAGTYQDGIYRSSDGGANWAHSLTGLLNAQVTGFALPRPSTILASTLFEGIQWSNDGGITWSDFNNNLGDTVINKLVTNPTNTNIVYALTNNVGLRRLDLTSGTAWQGITALAIAGNSTPAASPYKRKEPLDDLLALGGDMAQPTTTPAPQTQSLAPASTSQLLDMVFAPSNPQIAYLGTVGSGIYASADGGLSWAQVGLGGATVYSIAVDPKDPNHVFAVTGNVQVSTDGGHNWTSIPLNGLQVNTVSFPADGKSRVYAATSQGVWVFQNQGWSLAGLSGIFVQTIAINPAEPYWIFAGTSNGAYLLVPDANLQSAFAETGGTPIQSIGFDPLDPFQVYFGTVYRSTAHYVISH